MRTASRSGGAEVSVREDPPRGQDRRSRGCRGRRDGGRGLGNVEGDAGRNSGCMNEGFRKLGDAFLGGQPAAVSVPADRGP